MTNDNGRRSSTERRTNKPNGRFEKVEKIGSLTLYRKDDGTYHVGRYDPVTGQMRRVSLKTESNREAMKIVDDLQDLGETADLRSSLKLLKTGRIETVRDLLEHHRGHVAKLASHEAESIAIDRILASDLADRRIPSLRPRDFEHLAEEWQAAGLSVSTASRRLSTLRSALNRAWRDRDLKVPPPEVPEFCGKEARDERKPKGRPITPQECARLWDAAREPHLRLFLVFLYSTGARAGAILDLTGRAVDLVAGTIRLNPEGRRQTTKRRPILPIQHHLLPWICDLPDGPLITWRDRPVGSIKKAMRDAVARAGLSADVNAYSVRHGLARYMRARGISRGDIAEWLGHRVPDEAPDTTFIYTPSKVEYMRAPCGAAAAFFAEIAAHATTALLEPSLGDRVHLAETRQREERR